MKTCLIATKTCLTYAFVKHKPFCNASQNLGTNIFVASTISNFYYIVLGVLALAVLTQYDVVVHAMGPIAIACILIHAASTKNSIHQG